MAEAIGFVGVGRMGSRMVGHLLEAGYEVTVFDIDVTRVGAMVDAGAREAGSIAEVASAGAVVFTSLPDSAAVEDVYFGADGLLDSMRAGSVVIETSTILPGTIEAIEAAAVDRDIAVVGCPVIGTPAEAMAATLTVVVGCDDEVFDRVEPIIAQLGDRIEHVRAPGEAKRIKLANNVMTYGNLAVAAETLALVDRLDIDPERFFEIADSGAASSAIARSKIPKALEGDVGPGFPVSGALKDLRYANRMKDDVDFPTPIAAAVTEQYILAAAMGEVDSDYSVLVDVFKRLADREIGPR